MFLPMGGLGGADLGTCHPCNPGEIYLNPPDQKSVLPAWGWVWNFNLFLSVWSQGKGKAMKNKRHMIDFTLSPEQSTTELSSGRLNESLCGQFEAGGLSWEVAKFVSRVGSISYRWVYMMLPLIELGFNLILLKFCQTLLVWAEVFLYQGQVTLETSASLAFGKAIQVLLDEQSKQASSGEHLLRILFSFWSPGYPFMPSFLIPFQTLLWWLDFLLTLITALPECFTVINASVFPALRDKSVFSHLTEERTE